MGKNISLLTAFVFLGLFLFISPSYSIAQVNTDVSISAQVSGGGGGGDDDGNSIGSDTIVTPELIKEILKTADYNHDLKVDIIDLSILLFFYGKRGPSIAPYDLNGDGFIGLEDISVMLYYWSLVD